jgi:4-amino-4-deoxy-L-arabinose transferase-like glycosyltransferase
MNQIWNKIKPKSYLEMIFIIIFILLSLVIPIFYISSISLWGDEAAYLVIGNEIKEGAVFYRDIADVKSPGTYYIAAIIISIAGKSMIAARLTTVIFQALSALLILFLGLKIKDRNIGMMASILFLIAVYIPIFQGYYYMAEPFAVFFSILSVLCFFKNNNKNNLLSGLFLGIAILFKQTTILLFGVYFLYYLINLRFSINRTREYTLKSTKKLFIIIFGMVFPLFLGFLYFIIQGATYDFLYYTIAFLTDYKLPFIPMLLYYGFLSYLPIWILFIITTILITSKFLKGKNNDEKKLLLLIWSVVLLYPALTIVFNQRVLFAIPPITILVSILLHKIYQKLKNKQTSKKFKTIIIIFLFITSGISFVTNITTYNFITENFSQKEKIQNINEITKLINGKVYVFPPDNVIFFFSNLTPGVKYLGQVFSEEMANQVVYDLQENNVNYIVGTLDYINEFETNKIDDSNPNLIIFEHIKNHYEVLITINDSIIYKIK